MPKIKVAKKNNGFGTIGKRVADSVGTHDDMAILVGDTHYFDVDEGIRSRGLWAMMIEDSITHD